MNAVVRAYVLCSSDGRVKIDPARADNTETVLSIGPVVEEVSTFVVVMVAVVRCAAFTMDLKTVRVSKDFEER